MVLVYCLPLLQKVPGSNCLVRQYNIPHVQLIFLGVFELSVSNTVLGGLLLNTHQLCFSQFWQLTEPSLPHKYFKWKIIERVVQCGQHCHELLKPAGQVDKFNKELLTCILVLLVSMVGYALILELVQRKCGGKYRCFLLEGNRLRDIGEAFECLCFSSVNRGLHLCYFCY